MGQRIDDEIREQRLKEQAKKAAHIEKILTPEGFAEEFENIKEKISLWLADVNEPIHKQIDTLEDRITKLEALLRGHPHDKEDDHAD